MWAVLLFAILLGLALLFAELFIVPGVTVVGVAGLLFLGVGVWQIYEQYGNTAGHLSLVVLSLVSAWVVWKALRTKFWKNFELNQQIDSKTTADAEALGLVSGQEGKAMSALRPMGKARFGTTEVEVESVDGWIDQGLNVKIVALEGQKVFVKTN